MTFSLLTLPGQDLGAQEQALACCRHSCPEGQFCNAPYARVLWPETVMKSVSYAGRRVSQNSLHLADASATSVLLPGKAQQFRHFWLADTSATLILL